ncbi:restriction endonuclease [Luteimonas terrae]|uniref:Restriction system protein n=1 Tax=Luteimonas terrae TaxID=1530191 RepID=A0ABU1XTB4_9GAMM|nr:restriction endonuclease [Luteimonas terrae]MDR7192007.1 restriction system protein [Luteimonas terrae]
MGRARRSTLEDLAASPWPVGIVVGLAGYAGIRHGIPALFARQDGPFAQALAAQADALAPLAWAVLALCTVASLVSFVRGRKRRRLLDTRTGLDSLATIGWRNFECLVGEAFRRRGYRVEETGLGGADGGIDLILRKDGQRTLVQCKQWRREKVPVNVVREMYGLLTHHGAHAVRIVTVGSFTRDAARFTAGKPIELIDGATLLAMIREIQEEARIPESRPMPTPAPRIAPAFNTPAPNLAATPGCPRCGSAMVERSNRRANTTFWGCSAFPKCRGTR